MGRWHSLVWIVITMLISATEGAQHDALIIDDRSTGTLVSNLGTTWRGISDQVMGGLSTEKVLLDTVHGKPCLRLTGEVRLDNNGGFIQLSLDLAQATLLDASGFTGLHLLVYGNGESYSAHLRTADLRLPWQSYRYSFVAPAQWTAVRLPFSDFKPHRTRVPLARSGLKRFGLVAIGRPYHADVCLAEVALYR